MRKRNRLHKKAKHRNLARDWQNFRKIRNEVIDMIYRDAKKMYIINLQNSLVDKSVPPGKWWRIAKGVTKLKKVNHVKSPIKVNGDIFLPSHRKSMCYKQLFCTSIYPGDRA